jgi:hypothetical protein
MHQELQLGQDIDTFNVAERNTREVKIAAQYIHIWVNTSLFTGKVVFYSNDSVDLPETKISIKTENIRIS